jgi:hypothetical protein
MTTGAACNASHFVANLSLAIAHFDAMQTRVRLNVCPQSQHQVMYHSRHAALNELRVERVDPQIQDLQQGYRIVKGLHV